MGIPRLDVDKDGTFKLTFSNGTYYVSLDKNSPVFLGDFILRTAVPVNDEDHKSDTALKTLKEFKRDFEPIKEKDIGN